MIYKLTHHDKQRMTFTTTAPSNPYAAFATVAGIIGTGFLIHYLYPDIHDMPWSIIRFVLWAIGLLGYSFFLYSSLHQKAFCS